MSRGNKCGSRTRSGGSCQMQAGWGTDHVGYGNCKIHGGCMQPEVARAGSLLAANQLESMGIDWVEIHPMEAILELVKTSYVCVRWFASQVDDLEPSQLVEYNRISGGTQPHAWLRLYNEERDRLVKYSKLALDAGVDERQIRLAESQGNQVADAMEQILEGLDLSPDQADRVPQLVHRAFSELVEAPAVSA